MDTPSPRLLLIALTVHLSTLPSAYSQCHNLCSGNGECTANAICSCNSGYSGPDCSLRTCPKGNAWADYPDDQGGAHASVECSNRGTCDRTTGTCACSSQFRGGACEIMKCPNQCSEHGQVRPVSTTAQFV